jgi:hypothetical protein
MNGLYWMPVLNANRENAIPKRLGNAPAPLFVLTQRLFRPPEFSDIIVATPNPQKCPSLVADTSTDMGDPAGLPLLCDNSMLKHFGRSVAVGRVAMVFPEKPVIGMNKAIKQLW